MGMSASVWYRFWERVLALEVSLDLFSQREG